MASVLQFEPQAQAISLPDARVSSRTITALVVAAAALILFARKPDALVNPQFWAEDGTLFFMQQYERGAAAFLQDQAGYLHLVPRMIAWLADHAGTYAATPAIYNWASLLINLVVVAGVCSPRLRLPYKPLAALAVVLVPHHNNEVFLNITNLQWVLCLLPIAMLLKTPPSEEHGHVAWQYAGDLLIVLLCGLTGPFVLLLSPLFAGKWAQRRTRYNLLILLAVVAVTAVQAWFVTAHLQLTEQPMSRHGSKYIAILGQKVFGSLFLGETAYDLGRNLLFACYLALLAALLVRSPHKSRSIVATLLVIHVLLVLAAIHKFKADPEVLIPYVNGGRYFYVPSVMVLWALVACLGQSSRWSNVWPAALLALALICSLAHSFHNEPLHDYDWRTHSRTIGREEAHIPINPPGWFVHLPPRSAMK